jgi:gelsolin
VTTPGGSKVFAYDALVKMDGTAGIDMARKESYLSEREFETVFGLTRDAFEKLAEWKRKDAKKKVGLF